MALEQEEYVTAGQSSEERHGSLAAEAEIVRCDETDDPWPASAGDGPTHADAALDGTGFAGGGALAGRLGPRGGTAVTAHIVKGAAARTASFFFVSLAGVGPHRRWLFHSGWRLCSCRAINQVEWRRRCRLTTPTPSVSTRPSPRLFRGRPDPRRADLGWNCFFGTG
jgi:hypothetical protein